MRKLRYLMRSDNNNLEFLDLITLVGFVMQIMNYQENRQQTGNDDLMKELQKQDKEYLEKIIDNQRLILEKLADKG